MSAQTSRGDPDSYQPSRPCNLGGEGCGPSRAATAQTSGYYVSRKLCILGQGRPRGNGNIPCRPGWSRLLHITSPPSEAHLNIPDSYAVKAFGPAETLYSCYMLQSLTSLCLIPIYITMHIVPAICNCSHKHSAQAWRRAVTIVQILGETRCEGSRENRRGNLCVSFMLNNSDVADMAVHGGGLVRDIL
jgi:hypothetical protein